MDPSPVAVVDLLASTSMGAETLLQADRVGEWIGGASGPIRYLLVFVLAAIPWFEILLVVPIGIGIGLDPLLVAIAAIAGNALPIYGIVLAYERLAARFGWGTESDGESTRSRRARRIWRTYGLPGLALAAPILTGVHLAAVLALTLGASGRRTLVWMTGSIALWTGALTLASVGGLSILAGL